MNPILTPQLLLAVGAAGVIVGLVLFVVWLATKPKTKHRKNSKREPYVPAYGAYEGWNVKQWAPPPQPLDAHLDVYEQERIKEAAVLTAVEELEAAREARLRFEMERDAAKLRDVETAIIKQIRWSGYDPKEATQEIDPAFLERVRSETAGKR